jgi:hypothetical protein
LANSYSIQNLRRHLQRSKSIQRQKWTTAIQRLQINQHSHFHHGHQLRLSQLQFALR